MRIYAIFAFFILMIATSAHAWTEGALKVADPFSFPPNNLNQNSFKLGEGTAPTVQYQWHRGSFEWVRVDKRFVLPRAKVRLNATATSKVIYQNQHFFPNAQGKVDVPIVLTQEKGNEIAVEDPVTKQNTKLPIVFTPKGIDNPIVLDTSCSPSGLKVKAANLPHSWVYVVCKAIHPAHNNGTGLKLDVDIFWEMEGSSETIQVNAQTIELADGLSTSIAMDSNGSNFTFARGKDSPDTFELEVHLPDRFRTLGVAMGLGPYSHQNEVRGFATIYMSYYFNEAMKLATFGAFPIRTDPEVDLGLYLIAEQIRGVDERLIVNLLLGFHTLSFVPGRAIVGGAASRTFAFSAPQGIELIFRDFMAKRQNLTFGGFFYPAINNRSYFNTWVRYGGSIFAELNFIQWQEPVGNDTFGAKSFGLSIGFPLFRAL